MLKDWGASDYELIPRRADLAALQLGRALGFSDDSEEVRQAEMLFAVMFLRRRHRNERSEEELLPLRRQRER